MAEIIGTSGNDTLNGTSDDDDILSLEGDDLINIIAPNLGFDAIDGGNGTDTLRLDYSSLDTSVSSFFAFNRVYYFGNSTFGYYNTTASNIEQFDVTGGTDNDTLLGLAGNDTLNGSAGDDYIDAGSGNDTVAGGLGDDLIYGYDGNDILRGDLSNRSPGGFIGGNDTIYGGSGNDQIGGKAGNDELYGDEGNDKIWGDNGDDLLWGSLGNDTLVGDDFSGGQGSDTFVLATDEGTDTISDFQLSRDLLGLAGTLTFGQLAIAQAGNDTRISVNDQTLAILSGVEATALTDSFFTPITVVGQCYDIECSFLY